MYAYYTDNFGTLEGKTGLSEVCASWRMSFTAGKRLTFQPMLYGRMLFGSVKPAGAALLWDTLENMASPVSSVYPVSMERIGQSYGYTLYRTKLDEFDEVHNIYLKDAADRAKIYVDGKEAATLYDTELKLPKQLEEKIELTDHRLEILTENMGRVNFGPFMENQRKGIDGSVVINTHQVYHYDIFALPLDEDQLARIRFGSAEDNVPEEPCFYRFELDVDEPADTFVDMKGWGKGCVFVNGFNLGRFWEIGPQETLYLPGPLLKKGKNDIIVFETEGRMPGSLTFTDTPKLGPVLVQEV